MLLDRNTNPCRIVQEKGIHNHEAASPELSIMVIP